LILLRLLSWSFVAHLSISILPVLAPLAQGRLLDLIRRICCFGMGLVKLDIRQVTMSLNEEPFVCMCDSKKFFSFTSFGL
jgi:hypothetical protein